MGLSKRVSHWSVEEVCNWVDEQYAASVTVQLSASRFCSLQQVIIKHAISGRALLRMGEYHWERLGVEPRFQREILQDVLLLKVQEELENLNDIFSECFSS